jgi:hypothetical protein
MQATWLARIGSSLGAVLCLQCLLLTTDAWRQSQRQPTEQLQVIQTQQGLMLVDVRAEAARRRRARQLAVGGVVACAGWLAAVGVSWFLESRPDAICWRCVLVPAAVGVLACVLSLAAVSLYSRLGGLQRERQRERDSMRQRARLAAEWRRGGGGEEGSSDGDVASSMVWWRGPFRRDRDLDVAERRREPDDSAALERLLRACPHGNGYADECGECCVSTAVCSVCLGAPRNVRLGPCGHSCLCQECFARLWEVRSARAKERD